MEEQEEQKKKRLLSTSTSSASKHYSSNITKYKQSKLLLGAVVKRPSDSRDSKKDVEGPESKRPRDENKALATSSSGNALSALGTYNSDSDGDSEHEADNG